jgi:hypothetical protein
MKGLFLAFWTVLDTCPLFAVDAYSTTEAGFRLTSRDLPSLMKLIEQAPSKRQQVFATLKDK